MPKTNQQNEKKITLNSRDLVEVLKIILDDKEYKKKKPMPKFTLEEAKFIRDLIFHKPKDLIFIYLADLIINKKQNILFSAINMRRLKWLHAYLETGNATQAVRMSGYSKKCAKQQGHRIFKKMQSFFRDE